MFRLHILSKDDFISGCASEQFSTTQTAHLHIQIGFAEDVVFAEDMQAKPYFWLPILSLTRAISYQARLG